MLKSKSDARRLAVILRPFPEIFVGGARDTGDPRSYYYDRLWRTWSPAQRSAARALSRALAPAAFLGGSAAHARKLGFSTANLAEILARRAPDTRLETFFDQDERKGIHAIINAGGLPLDANPLKNKHRFEIACRTGGLPLPETIGGEQDARRHEALISKPRFGSKGKGVRRLVRGAGGRWRSSDGAIRLGNGDFGQWLARERSRNRIVQQCLAPHSSVAAMSPGALPTLRIVTCLDENGAPEVTETMLRLSLADDRAADNFNADNLVAAVDKATGRIGRALRRAGNGFVEHAAHPTTGAPIAGTRLELLEQACALAIAGHRLFGDFVVIGWDIGLSSDGAVMIEGNWNPGVNVVQLVHGRPIGETRLGALYRFHLERAAAGRWAAALPIQNATWRRE